MGGFANRACGICDGAGFMSRSHSEEGWDIEECPCSRSEAIESMESSGYDLKEAGCDQVVNNAPKALKDAIFRQLSQLIELQPLAFTTDDLHERAGKLLEEVNPNFVGGAIFSAQRSGLIEWTGSVAASSRPRAKSRTIKVWRKAVG
jgi:hypothetical protein